MFVLMGYGPFTFSLATFSYEELVRKAEARIEEVAILGGRPSLHRSGLGLETISLESLFHPRHMANNQGLPQVAMMRASVGESYPLIGNRIGAGDVLGRWVLKSVETTETEIFVDGLGQAVGVRIELLNDGPSRPPGAARELLRLIA